MTDIPMISIDNLQVNYGDTVVLKDLTLHLPVGRICGIVGQNGSGKSTLFKAVMGLVRPVQGHIRICGKSRRYACKNSIISYVPQNEAIDPDFPVSVYDVVMMGRYGFMGLMRRPRPSDHQAVDQALKMVGMSQYAHRQIGALSGGQRKRAFIARGIAQGARIMILDEPFAGVDKPSEHAITALLHSLKESGKTIMVSTHDLPTLPDLCDDVALLHQHIQFYGTPEEALRPENLVLAFGSGA